MPTQVPKGQQVEQRRGFRDNLKGLLPGTAPGFGGMRPEYLRVVG